MLIDTFCTRIIHINNVFNSDILEYLNFIIKNESKDLAYYKKYNLTYISNIAEKENSDIDNNLIDEHINLKLINDGYEWKSYEKYWFNLYENNTYHEAHDHYPIFLRPKDEIGFYYSCVIYMDDEGGTMFLNPNNTSFKKYFNIQSEKNSMILFPSSLYHYSISSNSMRKTFATNGFLRGVNG